MNMTRRKFVKNTLIGTAAMTSLQKCSGGVSGSALRLGGPIFDTYKDPGEWARAHKALGYSAAYCPVDADADEVLIRDYVQTARKNNIIIAEVGVWNNPISRDESQRTVAIEKCQQFLHLADHIGAQCCVNISGSRGEQWDGPDADNLTPATFDLIVETTRTIIDAVSPKQTFYTLETMPWSYPDSADSYVRLVKAIDRPQFAVHLDPVNLICSPQRFYGNAELIRECFLKLGPKIKSCHAKDIILLPRLTTHLDEVRPGLGGLDYSAFLTELSKLSDIPLMLEHLQKPEEYTASAEYIRTIANKNNLSFVE
jgi:sugar phosphate isomerase/epimerase